MNFDAAIIGGRLPNPGSLGELQAGVTAAAQEILKRSNELCPVKTGATRNTSYVRPDDSPQSAGRAAAVIVYTTPYSPIVHEVTEYEHAPPTGAKFLSRAAQELQDRIPFNIKATVETSRGVK